MRIEDEDEEEEAIERNKPVFEILRPLASACASENPQGSTIFMHAPCPRQPFHPYPSTPVLANSKLTNSLVAFEHPPSVQRTPCNALYANYCPRSFFRYGRFALLFPESPNSGGSTLQSNIRTVDKTVLNSQRWQFKSPSHSTSRCIMAPGLLALLSFTCSRWLLVTM
ncbi:hypothetical protein EJ06DRAFT_361007 [Trichodelitschia bisporula]|uniref:Uncharacterized protein n=1 Tax=Trichodelitschia bisporula TaxID=703511 RepID=A0A6G1I0F2_9PEZI|nr:hypothetical protein EJ06DRAFT_361007 [Trichodelitschia bisporula]